MGSLAAITEIEPERRPLPVSLRRLSTSSPLNF